MKDGSNYMSEKEFLLDAINGLNFFDKDWVELYVDKYLKYHHTKYYEVEFIAKEREDETVVSDR